MLLKKSLEIDFQFYEPTKNTLIINGTKVSEQNYGSRKILYSDNQICGFSKIENNLILSEDLDSSKFYVFLGSFKRSLYNQIRLNNDLLNLKIEFDHDSRAKNHENWSKIKNKSIFYNIDITSAYWQIAHKLGYISTSLFKKYQNKDEYKEAKRYCISFLARENSMSYFDNRKIDIITCDISCFEQIYENVRNELYKLIYEITNSINNWIEYNIDAISVSQKDIEIVLNKFKELNIDVKVNECLKIDSKEYFSKGKIRKF